MKKRVKIIISSIVVIILLLFAVIYVKIIPLLRLKNTVKEITNTQYSYTADVKIVKSPLNIFDEQYEFNLNGQKSSDVLYGEFVYSDKEIIDIYVDSNMEMVFDITPIFDAVADEVEGTVGFSANLLKKALKQVTVSLSQIEEIVGQKVDIAGDKNADYKISLEKNLDSSEKILGENAYYYRLSFDNKEDMIIIAIPQKSHDKEIYFKISSEKFEAGFIIKYELCDVGNISMPEPNVTDSMIETIKSLYQYIVK